MSIETDSVIDKKTSNITPKEPGKFNVIVFNDSFTTFEFVVELLTKIYNHNEESAVDLTISIHNQGQAVVGVYTYEIAEQKVIDGITMARSKGFPLKIILEEQ